MKQYLLTLVLTLMPFLACYAMETTIKTQEPAVVVHAEIILTQQEREFLEAFMQCTTEIEASRTIRKLDIYLKNIRAPRLDTLRFLIAFFRGFDKHYTGKRLTEYTPAHRAIVTTILHTIAELFFSFSTQSLKVDEFNAMFMQATPFFSYTLGDELLPIVVTALSKCTDSSTYAPLAYRAFLELFFPFFTDEEGFRFFVAHAFNLHWSLLRGDFLTIFMSVVRRYNNNVIYYRHSAQKVVEVEFAKKRQFLREQLFGCRLREEVSHIEQIPPTTDLKSEQLS